MKYVVLGAGRQGLAIAYDLALHGEGSEVVLVDADVHRVRSGAARLRRLVPHVTFRAEPKRLSGSGAVAFMRGCDAVVSAMPYRFNVALAKAAVRARASFCDLGGNTSLVQEALKLHGKARKAGITLVPDCGLAPGLGNVLAAMGVAEVEGARHVRIRCGGLPLEPRGPLGYSLLFDLAGVTNEYTGKAVVLRRGKVEEVEAFTEVEPFRGPRGLGRLEAFHTSGGSSTAPWTFKGKLETYEYKTVRYRGHFVSVRAMIELGLLDLEPVYLGKTRVVPRDLFHAVAGPRLDHGEVKDLAILRVDVTDEKGRGVRYSLLDVFDSMTGFTAMSGPLDFLRLQLPTLWRTGNWIPAR